MTDHDLKPCPFCGSTEVGTDRNDEETWIVCCDACDAEGPWSKTEADAIAAWNRRTA